MLSPMLFFIMMEVFSRMLRRVEGAGIIYFKAEGRRGGGECVSRLLFADDIIHFVMQMWSKFFIFNCCYFVFKL